MTAIHWLLDPLTYDFMQQALIVGILVGILCPVVGSYLIVQRMTFLANVISHSVLPGLAIANFLGIDVLIGAFASGMLSTIVISWIRTQSYLKVDAVMNATLASFFALGILLVTVLQTRLDLEGFLFGDILSVTATDMWRSVVITISILFLIVLFYRPLLFYTFDEIGAKTIGFPVVLINFGLTAAISLTIIAGMQAVGVILIMAMMICPAIAAYLLVKELHWMMILGAGLGMIASTVGLYCS
jgi:manganese/iron transport system permease protein